MELTLEQAFNTLKTVCDTFKGTLKEHEIIQASLKTIMNNLFQKPIKSELKTKQDEKN